MRFVFLLCLVSIGSLTLSCCGPTVKHDAYAGLLPEPTHDEAPFWPEHTSVFTCSVDSATILVSMDQEIASVADRTKLVLDSVRMTVLDFEAKSGFHVPSCRIGVALAPFDPRRPDGVVYGGMWLVDCGHPDAIVVTEGVRQELPKCFHELYHITTHLRHRQTIPDDPIWLWVDAKGNEESSLIYDNRASFVASDVAVPK